ncbi:MAG: YheT family hydrolase, partial [Balneolaceae bacterium]
YTDLSTAVDWCRSFFGVDTLFCVGFSLGASVLLNLLAKDPAADYIRAFCAISTPYDLKRGSINLQRGLNKIYEVRFMRTLRSKLAQKKRQFSDLPDFTGQTLYDFDDQVTGPVHGFSGAEEYYKECSSAFLMDGIDRPGLLVHSQEDPLCPFAYTPTDTIDQNPHLTTLFPERGGHVGFWSLPPGWLEESISRYLALH